MADNINFNTSENDSSRPTGSAQFERLRGQINRNSHFFLGRGTVPDSSSTVQLGSDEEVRARLAEGRSGVPLEPKDAMSDIVDGSATMWGDERAVPFPKRLDNNRRPDVTVSSETDTTSRVGPGVPRIITSPRVDPVQARSEDAALYEGILRSRAAIEDMMTDTGAPIYRAPQRSEGMSAEDVARVSEMSKRQRELTRDVRDADGNVIDMKAKTKGQANDKPKGPNKGGRPKSATTPAPKKDVGRPKKETAPKKAVGRPKKETAPKKAVGRPKKNK
jgi:hypothetical protein